MMKREPINPYDMPVDSRTWNTFWQQVVATETVDAILRDVFQGKKDGLREQMLSVAAKRIRRIEWGPTEDIDETRREAIIAQARVAAIARREASRVPKGQG